jgi:hypothetical protein
VHFARHNSTLLYENVSVRRDPAQCFPAQDGAAGLHALRPKGAVPQGNFNHGVWRGDPATDAANAHCQVRERGQDGDGLRNLFRGFEAEGLVFSKELFLTIRVHYHMIIDNFAIVPTEISAQIGQFTINYISSTIMR